MKIIVCIKQVPDTEASLVVREGCSLNEATIKWIISPYDEYAIEEALRLKEKFSNSSVLVLTLGPNRCESALRTALAMGADQAVHLMADFDLDPFLTAKAISEFLRNQSPFDIVFMGKQAIDDDAFQVHVFVAHMLDIGVATNVSKFDYKDGECVVERDIVGGDKEVMNLMTPCIIAAAKGLNTPRYASVMGIMKAKKLSITSIPVSTFGIDQDMIRAKLLKLVSPPEKPQGRIIPGEPQEAVSQLVRLLREEAKVL